MPTLTGSVADVTGVALAPGQIRQVFVKAPGERPSLADGGVLIVSAPVQLGSSGSLSVTLEPGPAVLTVDTYAGGPDVYDLYVTADMTLLSEAIDEAAPEHERSWSESVMIQLRDEAVAAAGRAEAAAGNVDAAISGAADAVVQAVEQDRVAAQQAATAAAGSESAASGSASAAAGSEAGAVAAQEAAADMAQDAAGSATDAETAAGLAEGSASAAVGSASAAAGSATAADGHAGRAETAANEFGLTVSSTTGAPGTNAAVTVTGEGPAYSLGFTVPQGAKGDKGDDGEVSQAALDAAVASLVDNAPEALNTLSELADALGGDPNFATTVSEAIGRRARIDGAPEQYDTLGKLVSALIAGDLGGSTDASLLTGALTAQVDASEATSMVYIGGDPQLASVSGWLGTAFSSIEGLYDELEDKADVGHTHPVSDLAATGSASSATFLRGDGSWQTPANTTYAVPTQAEAESGTATTARAFTAQRVAQAAIAASGKKDWQGTQAQYDALGTKDADRTYWIV